MEAIWAEGLRKVFPGGVEALKGIDLAVEEGEVVGFLGPNGAGKTTAIRILTTLLRPTAGRTAWRPGWPSWTTAGSWPRGPRGP